MKPCPMCGGGAHLSPHGNVVCGDDSCGFFCDKDFWDRIPRPVRPLHVCAKLIDDLVLEIHKRPHGWGDRFNTPSEAELAIRDKLMSAMGHEVDE